MELVLDNHYKVTPIRFERYGAIVELEDGSTQLIHISMISDKYVKEVSDYLNIGDTYDALCVVNTYTQHPQLSLKHLSLKSVQDYIRSDYNHERSSTRSKYNNKHSDRYSSNDKHNRSTGKQVYNSNFQRNHKHHQQSLDDMINAANACYMDKMRSQKRRDRK